MSSSRQCIFNFFLPDCNQIAFCMHSSYLMLETFFISAIHSHSHSLVPLLHLSFSHQRHVAYAMCAIYRECPVHCTYAMFIWLSFVKRLLFDVFMQCNVLYIARAFRCVYRDYSLPRSPSLLLSLWRSFSISSVAHSHSPAWLLHDFAFNLPVVFRYMFAVILTEL